MSRGFFEQEPQIKYKYTIWVGSSILAVGYKTNAYEKADGDIKFKVSSGKTKIVPMSSLLSVDEN